MHGKRLLIASLSLAILSFAAPMTASAAEWTKNGLPLENNQVLELAGPAAFEDKAGNGFHCEVTVASLRLEPGSNGTVTSFTTQNPKTTCIPSGMLAPCKVKSAMPEKMPWAVQIKEGGELDIEVKGVKIVYALEPVVCPSLTIEGNATLIANDNEEISFVGVSGAFVLNGTTNVNVLGSLAATPAGEFGIG